MVEIESCDAVGIFRSLKDLRMPKGVDGIVVTRLPMLLHAEPREFVILGIVLIYLGAVNEMHNVIGFVVREDSQCLVTCSP